ncbi:MAG: hypothetical protein DRG73_10800 [Deltaproteobacteria bacterium]|nr:MAG: hypothetical protein DRG73_10800 [Deltaproteobacteria bacterium]
MLSLFKKIPAYRRDAEDAEKNHFSFAVERTAKENHSVPLNISGTTGTFCPCCFGGLMVAEGRWCKHFF